MAKRIFATLLVALFIGAPLWAQDDGEIKLRPTPPPISTLDFFKGTTQLSFTWMYMKLGQAEDATGDAPTGKGFNFEMSRGFKDGFGVQSHFMYLGLNVPLNDPTLGLNEDYPASAFSMGGMAVLSLKKGEKRDIAGEIIDKKATVDIFLGIDFTGTSFEMEDFANSGETFSVNTMEGSFPIGLVADFPLNYYVSLVPFGRLSLGSTTVTTTMPYILPLYSPPYYLWMPGIPSDSSYSSTRFDYGMDIDLRPFSNAPDWKVSVGTVLSQMSGMANGNLMITVSVKKEWGKHYSSTTFGPKLH